MQFHIIHKSSNKKTGPIPVTTSSKETCPDACSWKDNGCYAAYGPLNIHWRKITEGSRGFSWAELIEYLEKLPDGQLWRHNQAGDLVGNEKGCIDATHLAELIKANEGKRGFTYTHYQPNLYNSAYIKTANKGGFTINLSADSMTQADEYVKLKVGPVCVVLPSSNTADKLLTPEGNCVIRCPAEYKDDTTCLTCKLCAIPTRGTIIGFSAHGTGKSKVDKVLTNANN